MGCQDGSLPRDLGGMTIDPDSHFDRGIDVNGKAVELGDTDTDGHFVGYIDEQGTAWESRKEYDRAITAGRYLDAWMEWNYSGGVLGEKPCPEEFADAIASDAHYWEAVLAACEAVEDFLPGGIFHDGFVKRRAAIAALN